MLTVVVIAQVAPERAEAPLKIQAPTR